MNVLVLNAGSSSLKFQLMNTKTREVFTKGNCERIGLTDGIFGHVEGDGEKVKEIVDFPDHGTAIRKVIELINEHGFEMEAFGHRIVQGGWHFEDSALVDDEVLAKIYEVAPLAPLHNYAEAGVIEHCRETYPELPNVAVFDTSFHMGMPPAAYTYALPTEVREKLHIRKYGAHGTSHRYEWQTAKELLGETCHRVLSCHLGNGSSLCAIEDGVVRDTTMGLTPLDGLMMGTRCGSIDPATVCYLQREGGYTVDEVDTMMNKQSGLLALSDISSDSRDIEDAAAQGDEKAEVALDMFSYRAAQLILEMAEAMEGFDTIAFSAGIGENSSEARSRICAKLAWMGVKLDEDKNAVRSDDVREISAADSAVRVLVVPTNEELMIALDVQEKLA